MTARVLPISVVEPALLQLCVGALDRLRRPPGALTKLQPGDVLWVREPFHLHERFDNVGPLHALRLGATPTYAANLRAGERPSPQLGRRRFARELPRAWHRQHLVVRAIERQRLQAIAPQEIRAEGFVTREAYGKAWDRNLSIGAAYDLAWVRNPEVAVIHFEQVARALPGLADPAPAEAVP